MQIRLEARGAYGSGAVNVNRISDRFREEDYSYNDPIEVDPGFRDGRLLAVSDCKRAGSKKEHMAYYTPEQIKQGDLPCRKCNPS